jgi:hypothetical protein
LNKSWKPLTRVLRNRPISDIWTCFFSSYPFCAHPRFSGQYICFHLLLRRLQPNTSTPYFHWFLLPHSYWALYQLFHWSLYSRFRWFPLHTYHLYKSWVPACTHTQLWQEAAHRHDLPFCGQCLRHRTGGRPGLKAHGPQRSLIPGENHLITPARSDFRSSPSSSYFLSPWHVGWPSFSVCMSMIRLSRPITSS